MPETYPTDPAASDQEGAHVELVDRFALIPEALLYDPAIPSDAVRLYGALRRHGSDPTNCFPSYRRLGELLGRSARSVPAWVRSLEEAGWVERVPRFTLSGDPDSNGFRVFTSPRERASEREEPPAQRGPLPASERGASALESAPNESKGTRASRNDNPAEGVLSLPLSGSEQTAKDRASVIRESAERLLKGWWESKTPRPTQNYPGARKVLERLLDAGWSEAQVFRALPRVPIISSRACELALRQDQPGPAASAPIDRDREQGDGSWVFAEGAWRLEAS